MAAAPALHQAAKTFKSAVCLVPPRHTWGPIQEVRCFNDKSYVRWPPHINVLYPFLEAQHLEAAAAVAAEALREQQPFDVHLREFGHFEHGRSCTLWLRPEAPELLAVQGALAAAFPQCTDLSSDAGRGISAFTPHLSLGQWRTPAEVAAAQQRLVASWQAATFRAGGVAIIARQGFDDPFSVQWFVPFGGREPVAVGAPYIATVGEPCGSQLGSSDGGVSMAAAELVGIGAARADGSVWNFAYGANMCPSKLNGARSLHPLESAPARVPNWRLSFTHRGGMGNLVPLAPGETSPAGLGAVHGVLHRLSPADYGKLACMEHEYRPIEVQAQPYGSDETVAAVAFVTPEAARIAEGLPPPQRYLALLQEGAAHWGLDAGYSAWLNSLESIDSRQRDAARYYTSASGEPLPALPKIRTGSQPQRQGRGGGRQRQRRGRDGGTAP